MYEGLTFVPSGGLANRMCAIASAVNLCVQSGRPLRIIWFDDWGLRARFGDIFMPICQDGVSLKEASFLDKFTVDRARKRNLYIPRIYQKCVFAKTIDEQEVSALKSRGFDFYEWVLEGRSNYMSSYQTFGCFNDYNGLIRELFVPSPEVMDIVSNYTSRFTEYVVGVHIRRTDNIYSIDNSPLGNFVEAMKQEITENDNVSFFVATDDDSVKTEMRTQFGERIITPEFTADRQSLKGMLNGVAEMWTLAATKKILGSYGSTYSTMASIVGGIDLTLITK